MATDESIIDLAEKRDKLMEKANKLSKEVDSMEKKAEEIDLYITENCTHPKEHVRLKRFNNSIPQKTFWLCKICYQEVCNDDDHEERLDSISDFLDEILSEMPVKVIRK